MSLQVKLNLGLVLVTLLAFFYFVGKAKLKDNGTFEQTKRRKIHNRYVWYHDSFITRSRFRRIVTMYSSVDCYDMDQVKATSVKLFERSFISAAMMPILCLVLLKDVMITLLMVFVAYIYYNMTVDKAIDKITFKMLGELSNCIQSMRENFIQTENIASAVLLSDKGTMLETIIMNIYEILTAVDGKKQLDEFCRKAPLRTFTSLAMACYIVFESGDEKKSDGSSTFADSLISLRQEVDTEIRRLQKTRIAFKSLSGLALVGIVGMPLAEMFNLSQIPGTSVLIKGVYGMTAKALIILSTVLVYYVLSVLTRPSVVNQTDMISWISKLSRNKKWNNRILSNLIPKKYKTRMKLNLLISGAISSKNMEYIYTLKVVASSIIFVMTLVFLSVFTLVAKDYVYNNTGSLGFIPAQEMKEDQYKRLEQLDKEFLDTVPMPDKTAATAMVKGRISGLQELQQLEQADRLIKKYETYYSLTFKWYYIVIAYVFSIAGWFCPELSLLFRKILVQHEATEDVLQLQTLMIVISNTKLDVLKTLDWLQKQSTVHKAPLRFAYHEFTSNPDQALERLKVSVGNVELKRMTSKLASAIYRLSIHDAFSDIYLNKEQSLRMREMLQDETLSSKKEYAKLIAILPAALMLVLLFIGPIFILGIEEMSKMMSTLGGL